MPKRDGSWFPTIGVTVTVVFGLFIMAWAVVFFLDYKQDHADQRQNAADNYVKNASQGVDACRILPPEAGVFERTSCLVEAVSAAQETAYSKHDLKAQQEMAEWAFAMAIVSLLSFVGTLFGVIYVVRTFHIASHSNEIAREIGQAQVKAYIFITKVTVKPSVKPTRVVWEVNVTIKNSGQSPAREVRAVVDHPAFTDSDMGAVFPDLAPGQQEKRTIMAYSRPGALELYGENSEKLLLVIKVTALHRDIFSKAEEPRYQTTEGYAGTIFLHRGADTALTSIGAVKKKATS